MKPTYQLTDNDILVVKRDGKARWESNRKAGVKDKGVGNSPYPWFKDEIGLAGEIAFEGLTGLPRDKSIGPRKSNLDFLAVTGETIDTKATHYKTGSLLAVYGTEHQYSNIDVFVLMVGGPNTGWLMRYAGWAYHNELIVPERLGKKGEDYGLSYILEQYQLHKPVNWGVNGIRVHQVQQLAMAGL